MKCSAHFKAVLDNSLITVDTTSFHQHKLYYCMIALICHIAKVNSTSFVIQSPDQDIKGCVIQCLAERKSGSGHRQKKHKPLAEQEPHQPMAAWLTKEICITLPTRVCLSCIIISTQKSTEINLQANFDLTLD